MGAKNATLTYDPLGRLWEVDGTAGGGTTTRFLYDGDALVAEYDQLGNLNHRAACPREGGDTRRWRRCTAALRFASGLCWPLAVVPRTTRPCSRYVGSEVSTANRRLLACNHSPNDRVCSMFANWQGPALGLPMASTINASPPSPTARVRPSPLMDMMHMALLMQRT